jgi:hypothetical protein
MTLDLGTRALMCGDDYPPLRKATVATRLRSGPVRIVDVLAYALMGAPSALAMPTS